VSAISERCGLVREGADRVVEVTPIAVCLECMTLIRPRSAKFVDARGWCHYRHEHPLTVIRLRRSGQERSVEYIGVLPDWLRRSIEKMWYVWRAPPEEVAYKLRLLLEAYRLLRDFVRCYGADDSLSRLALPVIKSVHEPEWISDFVWRLYYLNTPRVEKRG